MISIDAFGIGLQNEISFLLRLQSSLSEYGYSVEKTKDTYSPVDYIVKRENDIVMYLELKTRTDLSKHNSFIIGRVKLERIRYFKKPVIIIWVCETTQQLFFIFYTSNLLTLKQSVMKNKRVAFIPKGLCSTSYDELIESIK